MQLRSMIITTALIIALVPTLGLAAGPTAPEPGDLPPHVLTGSAAQDAMPGGPASDGPYMPILSDDGTNTIDCEEKLADCLDIVGGNVEGDPEDPPKGPKTGKKGKKK